MRDRCIAIHRRHYNTEQLEAMDHIPISNVEKTDEQLNASHLAHNPANLRWRLAPMLGRIFITRVSFNGKRIWSGNISDMLMSEYINMLASCSSRIANQKGDLTDSGRDEYMSTVMSCSKQYIVRMRPMEPKTPYGYTTARSSCSVQVFRCL